MKLQRFECYPPATPHTVDARRAVPKESMGETWWFWCDGCDTNHSFRTKLAAGEQGPLWQFDGNVESPTFSPSLKYTTPYPPEPNPYRPKHLKPEDTAHVCHLFVEKGIIRYLNDCTHKLKGQDVKLPEMP